jgi:mRNA-degrading endonuclease RelE of RelBE toxin-antitoxin system
MPWHRLPCQGGFSQEKVIFLRLRGKLEGMQAISITSSYRLTLTILIANKEIILLDVGSRYEVYR